MKSIPDIVHQCAHRFDINVRAELVQTSSAALFRATRANASLVLKIGFNSQDALREFHALRAFSGVGAIPVADFDETLGALLLPMAEPGEPLSSCTNDERATQTCCTVFQRLHPAPYAAAHHESLLHHFGAMDQYQKVWAGGGPVPRVWIDRAVDYLRALTASTMEPVLLHGDLHHDNILRHEAGWVVIDPKGILGDRHFDVIQYLLNYCDRGGTPETVLARRVTMMKEQLALDPKRLAMWGVAKGVLDACWALEEGRDWQGGVRSAETFQAQLKRSKG